MKDDIRDEDIELDEGETLEEYLHGMLGLYVEQSDRERSEAYLRKLQNGYEINPKSTRNSSALFTACWNGFFAEELIAAGFDVNRPSRGDYPLHRAAYFHNTDVCSALLKAGARPNARNRDGQTPLEVAILQGNCSAVAVLLAHNANPELKTASGCTHLELVAAIDKTAVIRYVTEGQFIAIKKSMLDLLTSYSEARAVAKSAKKPAAKKNALRAKAI